MATEDTQEQPAQTKPFQLRTPHDASLVTQALEVRAEALDKLAKKTEEEGYARESRAIASDAASIRHHVLPVFRRQQELPLASVEDVRKMIANNLSTLVRPAVRNVPVDDKKSKEEQEELFRDRAQRLLDALAVRIEAYGAQIAEDAFQAGLAAREATPQRFGMSAVETLKEG